MKKLLNFCILLASSIFLTSCSSWVKLGNLTLSSTRNIDSKTEYKELRRYVEGYDDGKTITAARNGYDVKHNGTLTAAMEDAVRSVPGGEYMKNVEIYGKNGRVKVVGDIWGLSENANKNQYGFDINVGDKVMFKSNRDVIKGQIVGVDPKQARVKYYDSRGREQIDNVDYEKITKYTPDKDETIAPEAKFKIGQKVSWTEYNNKIRYGIVQDVNMATAKATVKFMIDDGEQKIKNKSFDDIFNADPNDYQAYVDKIQNEVNKHSFKSGDKVKWTRYGNLVHGQVVTMDENEMKITVKYNNDKGLERTQTVDAFDVAKDE